jgi:predicted methyltransferase
MKKTDYFGSFLGAMSNPQQSGIQSTGNSNTPTGNKTVVIRPVLSPENDPINNVLKALSTGDRPVRELIAYTDNSLTNFLSVIGNLQSLGLVEQLNGDILHLTVSGQALVASLPA